VLSAVGSKTPWPRMTVFIQKGKTAIKKTKKGLGGERGDRKILWGRICCARTQGSTQPRKKAEPFGNNGRRAGGKKKTGNGTGRPVPCVRIIYPGSKVDLGQELGPAGPIERLDWNTLKSSPMRKQHGEEKTVAGTGSAKGKKRGTCAKTA